MPRWELWTFVALVVIALAISARSELHDMEIKQQIRDLREFKAAGARFTCDDAQILLAALRDSGVDVHLALLSGSHCLSGNP